MRVVVSIVTLLVLARPAAADELTSKATFAVELEADGVPAWHVEAVARTLTADLVGERLLAPPEGTPAELVLRGELSPGELRYRIELPDRAPFPGVIALAGLDRAGLERAARGALHEVLDLRDAPPAVHRPARLGAPGVGGALIGLAAVACFLLIPFLVLRPPAGALVRLRSARRTALALALIAVAAVGLAAGRDRVPDASWAILIGGGLAWGAFAVVSLPHLLPPVPGLERVDHDALFPVLRGWAGLVVQRIGLFLLFYAPFGLALAGAAILLDLSTLVAIGVIAPLWGLAVRHWIHSWVDLLAHRLDARVVDGDPTAANPWHAVTRGYLRGYLRRAAWDADLRLVDDVLFLPGKADEILLYGGGCTPPRVVVARAWLELALAPYGRPHDYAAPRVSTLEWNEWNAGLVVPTEVGTLIATREQRQPREPEPFDETEHEPFGEPPTLAGYVEPDALDRRGAHRPEEDPLWLDWDPGDEPDGTDPSDKDFLFGLLVDQLGRIQRHEDRAATLALAAGEGRLGRWIARGRRVLARRAAVIADIHAMLSASKNHRIQALAWRATGRDDILTARAYPPELERRAAELLPTLDVGAAPFYRAGAPSRRAIWIGRAALAGVVLAGLTAFTVAALDALDYRDTYAQRTALPPEETNDGETE